MYADIELSCFCEDLDEIWSALSEPLAAPKAADDLMCEIDESTERLTGFLFLGGEAADAFLASKGYRRLIVQNYLIFILWTKVKVSLPS